MTKAKPTRVRPKIVNQSTTATTPYSASSFSSFSFTVYLNRESLVARTPKVQTLSPTARMSSIALLLFTTPSLRV